MGNAAAKEFEEKELGESSLDESKSLTPKLITTEPMMFARKQIGMSNNVEFRVEETDDLWLSGKSNTFGSKMSIYDSDGNYIATVKTKKGFSSDVSSVYKPVPTYEGQAAVPDKKGPNDEPYYLFAVINGEHGLTSGSATYNLVTGEEEDGKPILEPLYKSTKISTMKFMALIETVTDDIAVGKIAEAAGFSSKVMVQAAPGVDFAALVLVGQAVVPGGSSAGAMAGAGVV